MKSINISQLTKNPIGIIGLFIWLVYSIAGLVFATSATDLKYFTQLIFTLFIVIFPFIILGVFYNLVTKHHKKLYAPSDFKDERLFFRPATEEELKENKEESSSGDLSVTTSTSTGRPTSRPVLDYLAIETAALDIVEQSYGKKIPRDFVIELDGKKLFFDGVYQNDKTLDLFEVKVYRRPAFKREFIEAVMYRATSLLLNDRVNDINRDFRLWLVIVADFEGVVLDAFKEKIKNSVDTNNFDVKWKFLTFNEINDNA